MTAPTATTTGVGSGGTQAKHRVAIIGGGIGGLATALELTATEELRRRYDVTIYQMGWRLGGKCATGRDADRHDRVEEHGLHFWFGSYDNAFALLSACYAELNRPADSPIPTIADAWTPLSSVALYDNAGGADEHWSAEYFHYPVEPGAPWDPVPEPRLWDLVMIVVDFLRGTQRTVTFRESAGRIGRLLRRLGNLLERAVVGLAGRYADRHRSRGTGTDRHFQRTLRILRVVRTLLWKRAAGHLGNDARRHAATRNDLYLTLLIGLIADDIVHRGFASINDIEFRDWLRRNGVHPETLESPPVRVAYDQCFNASLGPSVLPGDGDGRDPKIGTADMAAGATLYGFLRLRLPYRGSMMWTARAGMGDTAIAPMYEAFVARGGHVEFFHRAEHLHLTDDRTAISSVTCRRQATTHTGGPYAPLRDVHGLPCWPNQPRWEQLVDGDRLRTEGVDFESDEWAAFGEPVELRAGEHFDTVVMAAHVAALPAMCGELISANPRFARMLQATRTTMTQAFQVWLHRRPADPVPDGLGYPFGDAPTSSFIEPLDTGCDMSKVLAHESWVADDDVRAVWYFCGQLGDDAGVTSDADQRERAQAGALDYLARIAPQWPAAVGADGFRWDLLAGSEAIGEQRFADQYWRANNSATERYLQTPTGSVESKLRAGESGFTNLVLAGDWTKNGMDIGAVESAAMGGRLAARAISGSPARIPWEGHEWLID